VCLGDGRNLIEGLIGAGRYDHQVPGAWIAGLLARRHFNIATVALANKTARSARCIKGRIDSCNRLIV
jgi:hypothetical protein